MRSWSLSSAILMLAVGVAGCAAPQGSNAGDLLVLDGFRQLLAFPVLDKTEYAGLYTHARFRQVKLGMTAEELVRILGEPFDRHHWEGNPWSETWHYSRGAAGGTYRQRNIVLHGGRVSELVHGIYYD